MPRVAILGSTGSIGQNALRVIDALGEPYQIVALGAGRSIERLADQVIRYRPALVSVAGDRESRELTSLLKVLGVDPLPEVYTGADGLSAVATEAGADTVISATVGALGFIPTYRALERGLRVALANKETLVLAGELMTAKAAQTGALILPVDSEHNALHQCLRGERRDEVRRLILTASGGPFRDTPLEQMATVTRAEALAHPTWQMGEKITVDSATLMNKGLEVIEAHWLYGFGASLIDIVVHPQSIVHSLVELVDGSIIAQLGVTDMRHALQYALTYPHRLPSTSGYLSLTEMGPLEFRPPDRARFPAISLAYSALESGGTFPAVLNGANEVAVAAFLAGEIAFVDIARIVEETLAAHQGAPADSIDNVLAADAWARQDARFRIAGTLYAETEV
jgi:1-deoxy-D-xylulose-5-phosphate reductoisomerase